MSVFNTDVELINASMQLSWQIGIHVVGVVQGSEIGFDAGW
jgi:hypothetical protein